MTRRTKGDEITAPTRSTYEFTVPDLALARQFLRLTTKEATEATKRLNNLALPADNVKLILHHLETTAAQLAKAMDEERGVIEGDVRLSAGELYVLKVGGWLYLQQLEKVEDRQTELAVPPSDTRLKAGQARELLDRLDGQASLDFGPVIQAIENAVRDGSMEEELNARMREGGYEGNVTVSLSRPDHAE